MDCYVSEVKFIRNQKKIEKKLFDELVINAVKEYGTWEYRLKFVEKLLKYNRINEWEYTEKMNVLKRDFNSHDDGSDDGVEVEEIDATDAHILVREYYTNIYYVISKENADIFSSGFMHATPELAIRWLRRTQFGF